MGENDSSLEGRRKHDGGRIDPRHGEPSIFQLGRSTRRCCSACLEERAISIMLPVFLYP